MMNRTPVSLAIAATLLTAAIATSGFTATAAASTWQAPAAVAADANPYPSSPATLAQGREVFTLQCTPCHGASGKGDGPAGAFLGKPMPDFTKPEFQQQTDGELFWKISNGNAPMPTFSEILETEQRWVVVDFLRTFAR